MTIAQWYEAMWSANRGLAELMSGSNDRYQCYLREVGGGMYALTHTWDRVAGLGEHVAWHRRIVLRGDSDILVAVNAWLNLVAQSEEEKRSMLSLWRERYKKILEP